jgi:CTP synthase
MAVVEFARNVAGTGRRHSSELAIPLTPSSILMPDPSVEGVTERGHHAARPYPCALVSTDSFAYRAYGTHDIKERHRHRYELSTTVTGKALTGKGLLLAGLSPAGGWLRSSSFPATRGLWGCSFIRAQKAVLQGPSPLPRLYRGGQKAGGPPISIQYRPPRELRGGRFFVRSIGTNRLLQTSQDGAE